MRCEVEGGCGRGNGDRRIMKKIHVRTPGNRAGQRKLLGTENHAKTRPSAPPGGRLWRPRCLLTWLVRSFYGVHLDM